MAAGSSVNSDVIIIGGGAAGLMCALTAARRGRRVRVIESANKLGKKILMSGGGRCNFTNLVVGPEHFLSQNPRFCLSALARFTPADFIAMVERHGIAYHEKELGQLFCDQSSRQILDMLLAECAAGSVQIDVQQQVISLRSQAQGFALETTSGPASCASLVVASGGLSIPKMGASGFGYELAAQFGHRIVPTRAALVPLTLSGRPLERLSSLTGISLPVTVSCAAQTFSAPLLFTHRGLSGPAILQISSYWEAGQPLQIDLLPGVDAGDWLIAAKRERTRSDMLALLCERLPRRVAQIWSEQQQWSGPLQQHTDGALARVGAQLNAWSVVASGTEGYRTAEVTLGGVDTNELSSRTMESQRVDGLYFIGEVVDVTGHLGGYNFQWAWASGHAAGLVV